MGTSIRVRSCRCWRKVASTPSRVGNVASVVFNSCWRTSRGDAVDAHLHHARGWIAIVATVVLISVHLWLFTAVSRTHLSLALIAGVAGVTSLKLAWWKFRR